MACCALPESCLLRHSPPTHMPPKAAEVLIPRPSCPAPYQSIHSIDTSFSPDGHRLASAAPYGLQVWDTATGTLTLGATSTAFHTHVLRPVCFLYLMDLDDNGWADYSGRCDGGVPMKRVSLRHGYRSAGRTIAVVLVSALFANPVFPQTKPAQRPSKTQNVAPFLPFFKAFNPRLEEFEFGDNKTIDGAWSAVVIRATSSRDTISQVQRDIHQLLMQEAFGVFLIRYDDPQSCVCRRCSAQPEVS